MMNRQLAKQHRLDRTKTMMIKAKDLQVKDEVMINDELHRITVSEPYPENQTMTLSYVIARPRTAAFRTWWHNDDSIEITNR